MNKVVVILYSYKDKILRECVDSIINNHSGKTDLSINVIDKNNLDRSENFKDVFYKHEIWDSFKSKFSLRYESISENFGDYVLYLDGSKKLVKDWDTELISLLGHKQILSGTNKIIFNNSEHKFFCTYKKEVAKEKFLTKWIDPSFIFTTFDTFKSLPNLQELKHNGESEILSLFCFTKQLDIYCVPNDYVVETSKIIEEYDYIPFSINHNYNYVIDTFKSIENIFFEYGAEIKNFEEYLGYEFSLLSHHPFPENDIAYDPSTSIDSIEGERFFGGIKSIY